jgi:group II intron reverse transcriptase/maturase
VDALVEDRMSEKKRTLLMDSSLFEKPERQCQRRLADYLKHDSKKKVHSLIDKVYSRANLRLSWDRVRANKGCGGIDGITLKKFEVDVEKHLDSIQQALKEGSYKPKPTLRIHIPKGNGKTRPLDIPSIYDRVVQQALQNQLEPIFEEMFDDSSFGYRKGRRQRDALAKIWRELEQGNEWIVDADLKDFFGSVEHEKLMTLVAQRISDGKVLKLIESILKSSYSEKGRLFPKQRGTAQGGVISPLLSNILLTPFDKELKRKGYRLTRWADDWVITCKSRSEAVQALKTATKILGKLGVTINLKKTKIVHIRDGFEFLGFVITKASVKWKLPASKIKIKPNKMGLIAMPTKKAIKRFKDEVRGRTKRGLCANEIELIESLNPLIRGWGNYFGKAHVRKLFNKLDGWIIRRIWAHKFKKWRCAGWKTLDAKTLRIAGLVGLTSLIPSLNAKKKHP